MVLTTVLREPPAPSRNLPSAGVKRSQPSGQLLVSPKARMTPFGRGVTVTGRSRAKVISFRTSLRALA